MENIEPEPSCSNVAIDDVGVQQVAQLETISEITRDIASGRSTEATDILLDDLFLPRETALCALDPYTIMQKAQHLMELYHASAPIDNGVMRQFYISDFSSTPPHSANIETNSNVICSSFRNSHSPIHKIELSSQIEEFLLHIEEVLPGMIEKSLKTRNIRKQERKNDMTSQIMQFLLDIEIVYPGLVENHLKKQKLLLPKQEKQFRNPVDVIVIDDEGHDVYEENVLKSPVRKSLGDEGKLSHSMTVTQNRQIVEEQLATSDVSIISERSVGIYGSVIVPNTQIPEEELFMAIVDRSSMGALTQCHLDVFKESLLKALDSLGDRYDDIGYIGNARLEGRFIMIKCKNQQSKEWLRLNVPRLTGLWQGAQLDAGMLSVFAAETNIVIDLLGTTERADIILNRLRRQNTCVGDISKWNVTGAYMFEEGAGIGVRLIVWCPKQDAMAIADAGGTLNCGLDQAVVKLGPVGSELSG